MSAQPRDYPSLVFVWPLTLPNIVVIPCAVMNLRNCNNVVANRCDYVLWGFVAMKVFNLPRVDLAAEVVRIVDPFVT